MEMEEISNNFKPLLDYIQLKIGVIITVNPTGFIKLDRPKCRVIQSPPTKWIGESEEA